MFHTKYRPIRFEEIVGHKRVVNAVGNLLIENKARSFLFHGPAGTGKTTFARVIANEVGCDEQGLMEIDGATNTGVDQMRAVADTTNYHSLGGGGTRVYIVDECHMLSKNAWNSLLKNIEEPPEHIYWIFCTTEPHKVPKTIRSRCSEFKLEDLSMSEITKVLVHVILQEDLSIEDDIVDYLASSAMGSPRVALVNLAKVLDARNVEEAEKLITNYDGPEDAFQLAKLLFAPKLNRSHLFSMLFRLKDLNPESIRITVFAFATTVILKNPQQPWAPHVLSQFETPCIEQNKIGDIALRILRLLHGRKARHDTS